MREDLTTDGLRIWTPIDPNDKALLRISEGATFGGTTFPSGWVSPPGKQVARNGKLHEVKPLA